MTDSEIHTHTSASPTADSLKIFMNGSLSSKNRSALIQGIAGFAFFLLAFGGSLASRVRVWSTDEDYSHGFLVIPVALFVVWQRRRQLARAQIQPSVSGWVILIIGLLMLVVGTLAEISTLSSLSIVVTLCGLVLCYFGFTVFRLVLFPLFFLLFMIPIPSQIYSSVTLPLQLLVTKLSVEVLYVLRIPAYCDGNIIHLPESTLQVVQACSGLRSMVSLSALSALFALTVVAWPLRVLIFLAAIPISIAVNIFRVSVTAWITYGYGQQAAEGAAHEILGVSVFALSLLLLFFWKVILTKFRR